MRNGRACESMWEFLLSYVKINQLYIIESDWCRAALDSMEQANGRRLAEWIWLPGGVQLDEIGCRAADRTEKD